MKSYKKLIFSLPMIFVFGCAGMSADSATNSGLVGAGSGAVIGAGAGAAIKAGSSVGRGALVGGLIGIPVGALVAITTQSIIERSTIDANQTVIEQNYADLVRGQADLDAYREKLESESGSIVVDESRRRYRYEAPSLGDYYQ